MPLEDLGQGAGVQNPVGPVLELLLGRGIQAAAGFFGPGAKATAELSRQGGDLAFQPIFQLPSLEAYRWRDDRGRLLLDRGTIRVFELSKFDVEPVQSDAERWLRFLKDGETLDSTRLPA